MIYVSVQDVQLHFNFAVKSVPQKLIKPSKTNLVFELWVGTYLCPPDQVMSRIRTLMRLTCELVLNSNGPLNLIQTINWIVHCYVRANVKRSPALFRFHSGCGRESGAFIQICFHCPQMLLSSLKLQRHYHFIRSDTFLSKKKSTLVDPTKKFIKIYYN